MTLEVAFCVSCPSLHSHPYPTPSSPSGLNPSIPASLPLHNYSMGDISFLGRSSPSLLPYSRHNLCACTDCSMALEGLKAKMHTKEYIQYLSFRV